MHTAVSSCSKFAQSAIPSGCRTAYDAAYPLRQRSGKRKDSLVDDYIKPLKEPTPILEANGQHCSGSHRVAVNHHAGSAALGHQPAGLVVNAVAAVEELLAVNLDCGAPFVSLPSRLAELWELAQNSVAMPGELATSMAAKFQNECRVFVEGELGGPVGDDSMNGMRRFTRLRDNIYS